MPKVVVREVELELSINEILSAVRQLSPEERELVRQVVEPAPWDQRLEALLSRVWARLEQHPISDEEIDAEIELVRTILHAQSGD